MPRIPRGWFVAGTAGLLLCALPSSNAQSQRSSISLIGGARSAGRLTLDQWALYEGYALRAPSLLPREYRSAGEERCAGWILSGIGDAWSSLAGSTQAELMRIGFTPAGVLARPTGLDSLRTTPHFLVHFATNPANPDAVPLTDLDGNGTPDHIDTVVTTIEQVWSSEIGTMGYTPPPPDGTAGGSTLYDVYVFKLGPAEYGYCQRETRIGDNPNSGTLVEHDAFLSYLALRNNYAGFTVSGSAALRATMAHEFYHAIQDGYDGHESAWMAEATATWAEDEVYDAANSPLQYLPGWFARPFIPLDANNSPGDSAAYGMDNWYGSWIFFRYLSEHLTGRSTALRSILEQTVAYDNAAADHSFDQIANALALYGTNFNRVFRDFATANASLTLNSYRYREGGLYPSVARYIVPHDTTIAQSLPRHSSFYYQVPRAMLPDCGKSLTVRFTPMDAAASLGVECALFAGGSVSEIPFQSHITFSGDIIPDSLFVIALSYGTVSTGNYTVAIESHPKDASYTITDLGIMGNGSSINAINAHGQVVGTQATYDGQFTTYNAFLVDNGHVQYVGSNDGALDINNRGEIAGWVRDAFSNRAYLWGQSGSFFIDTLRGGFSRATAINDSGYVVGHAFFSDYGTAVLPFIFHNGVVSKLPLTNDTNAIGGEVHDINAGGSIIGVIYTHQPNSGNAGPNHAALWSGPGAATDLGSTIVPNRINASGSYVGYMFVTAPDIDGSPFSTSHAFVSPAGDLGTIDGALPGSQAKDINNAGEIVGSSFTLSGGAHAFLWTHGGMVDLNNRLGFGQCWTLEEADAINDSGLIAGLGRPASDPGHDHGFLLTPIATTVYASNPSSPLTFSLSQNYPNPFNPSTTIVYDLGAASRIQLKIYDLLGREVATLRSGVEPAGRRSVAWIAAQFASGVYFCRLDAVPLAGATGSFSSTRKLLLLK